MSTYTALGGEVGLHSHGMLDHQLRSDLTEQIQRGDACDQPHRVQILMLCTQTTSQEQNNLFWEKITLIIQLARTSSRSQTNCRASSFN